MDEITSDQINGIRDVEIWMKEGEASSIISLLTVMMLTCFFIPTFTYPLSFSFLLLFFAFCLFFFSRVEPFSCLSFS